MLHIPLLNGETWTVRAKVIGDLALHRMRIDKRQWSVTHVPTLLSFTAAVPREIRMDRGRLLEWMAGVQKDGHLGGYWTILHASANVDVTNPPAMFCVARDRVFEHCRKYAG